MGDPKRSKQLLSYAKTLESKFFKQKPFALDKLNPTEQRRYKTYSKLLADAETAVMQAGMPGISKEAQLEMVKSEPYQAAQAQIPFLREKITPLLAKGAPIIMPEFTYSPESLKALTEDPDLMSSFFGSPDDDMDAFLLAQKRLPEPGPEPGPEPEPEPKVAKSLWEEDKTTIMVAGPGGVKTPKTVTGGFKLKEDVPERYKGAKGEQLRQQEEASLYKDIQAYEDEIAKADKNISAIDRAMQQLSGKPLQTAQKQKDKFLKRKEFYNNKLSDIRPQYDYIKKPKR